MPRSGQPLIGIMETAAGGRLLPAGLRKLQETPLCERCRHLQTHVVRQMAGRQTALCVSCDWRCPSVDGLAARNRRELEGLERDLRNERI